MLRELAVKPLVELGIAVGGGVIVGNAVQNPWPGLVAGVLLGIVILGWSRVSTAAKLHAEQLAEIERLQAKPRPDLEFSDLGQLAGYDYMRILDDAPKNLAGFLDGSFIAVEITNCSPSRRPIAEILAKIEYRQSNGTRSSVEGLWSAEPGPEFVPGGPRAATIGFGDSRVLLLGLFSRRFRTWLEFARTDYPPDFSVSPHSTEKLVEPRTGRRADLGPECELFVRLAGNGLEEAARWRLGFTGDNCTTWERLPVEAP